MGDRLWKDRPEPRSPILQVGVVLTRLCEKGNYTPELFQSTVADSMACNDAKQQRLDATMDKLRARYGRSVVYFGSVQDSRYTSLMRILFTHIPDVAVESE